MKKQNLAFVHDLLCSWCYGFQPVMQEIIVQLRNDFNFEFVSSGLFINKNVRPIQEVFPKDTGYKAAYQKISQATGADIRPAYLDKLLAVENYLLDSEIVAIGFHTYQALSGYDPLAWLKYQETFQNLLYQQGLNPNHEEIYRQVAHTLEIDPDRFIHSMKKDQYRQQAKADFMKTRKVFHNKQLPSLYLEETEGKYTRILSGYAPLEKVMSLIKQQI